MAGNNQSEAKNVFANFPYMLENNETIKDTEIKTQLKPRPSSVKQKARPVPLHLQEDVGREIEKLMKTTHLKDCLG